MGDKEKDMEDTRLSLKQIMKKDMEEELLHGIKVCNLAFHFGKRLGLSYDRATQLATAGLLHDMGNCRCQGIFTGETERLWRLKKSFVQDPMQELPMIFSCDMIIRILF